MIARSHLRQPISDFWGAVLSLYPGKSFSALVQEVLAERVAPRDLTPILELADFVASGSDGDDFDSADRFKDRPEDRFYDRAR